MTRRHNDTLIILFGIAVALVLLGNHAHVRKESSRGASLSPPRVRVQLPLISATSDPVPPPDAVRSQRVAFVSLGVVMTKLIPLSVIEAAMARETCANGGTQ